MENQKNESNKNELVVFIVTSKAECDECKAALSPGNWITLELKKAFCLTCSDLDYLEFLPAGDAAMTRRSTKHSSIHAKVLKWSKTRKRYERQGILVEPEAIQRAEQECLSDKDLREARQARESIKREQLDKEYVKEFHNYILKLFPGCPIESAEEIAQHACLKYSGRVGRSAGAKQFEDQAIVLAVRAFIRHKHTRYDELLMNGYSRDASRNMIERELNTIVKKWKK